MNPMNVIQANASRKVRVIALSEGADPRIVEAAVRARETGLAQIILVGPQAQVEAAVAQHADPLPEGIAIHDPVASPLREKMAETYHELRKRKGMTLEAAREAVLQPHVYAALLVRLGEADGTVGGAVATTADIVRAAIQVIGTAPGAKMVSSYFLMIFDKEYHAKKGAFIFSDSGLVVNPSDVELAEIAKASAVSYTSLLGEAPRVAMLSFSTRGSASHEMVSKVASATQMVRDTAPELTVDGELQFDAAFVPSVAQAKASDSPLAGNANVFIFPNLDAGNIGYKIAQRMGGAMALGPILQGLAKPANDLSRGCNAEDVLNMIAITAAQVQDD